MAFVYGRFNPVITTYFYYLVIFITVNLALEFEGQSSTFAFITDAVDCGLFLCCFCVLTFTIVTEIKY